MKIIKATDAIPVEHPVFCWFGQPGIGKSSLGYSTRDPLLLDFDGGAHRAANRRDTLAITTWDDIVELIENKGVLDPYATIVVDTVGRCLDVMTTDIIATIPRLGQNGNLTQQGWGVLKMRFRTWIAQLRQLGKDVALIAHDKEDKDGDIRVVRPDIVGGSYGEVMKVADFVAYIYMAGKDRTMDFSPSDRWVAKNPAGWRPFPLPPISKAQDFMADLFNRGRTALGAISEASANVTQQVEDWRAQIGTFTLAEDCNRAIPTIQALPPIVVPQVKKLLVERAKQLNVVWDTGQKAFVQATQPAAATV